MPGPPRAATAQPRPGLPASALAGSVGGHLLIGTLIVVMAVAPPTDPPKPLPVDMVFAPPPDAPPPDAPPPEPPPPEPPPPAPPTEASPPQAEASPPEPARAPEPSRPTEPAPPAPATSPPPRRPPPAKPTSVADAHPPIPHHAPTAIPNPSPTAAPPPTPAPNPTPPPLPAPSPAELSAWRGALSAWLNAHQRYPDEARRDGVQGQPIVRFTVERSGRVTTVELITSSGSTVLDDATLAMVRGATLPPFPPGIAQPTLTETVRVRYALEH